MHRTPLCLHRASTGRQHGNPCPGGDCTGENTILSPECMPIPHPLSDGADVGCGRSCRCGRPTVYLSSFSPSFQPLLSKGQLPEAFLALPSWPPDKTLSHDSGTRRTLLVPPGLSPAPPHHHSVPSCPFSLPIHFLLVFQDPLNIPPPGSLPECSSQF